MLLKPFTRHDPEPVSYNMLLKPFTRHDPEPVSYNTYTSNRIFLRSFVMFPSESLNRAPTKGLPQKNCKLEAE